MKAEESGRAKSRSQLDAGAEQRERQSKSSALKAEWKKGFKAGYEKADRDFQRMWQEDMDAFKELFMKRVFEIIDEVLEYWKSMLTDKEDIQERAQREIFNRIQSGIKAKIKEEFK